MFQRVFMWKCQYRHTPNQCKEHGPIERTLIIADEGSSIHYVEGCTAPTYSTESTFRVVELT